MYLAQRKQSKSLCRYICISIRRPSPYGRLCRSSNPQWYGTGTRIALPYEPYHGVTVRSPSVSDIGEDFSSIAEPCSKEERVQRGLSCIVMLAHAGCQLSGAQNRKKVDTSKMPSCQRLNSGFSPRWSPCS